jgi:hypothetical protein
VYFLGSKGDRCVRLTTLPPSCAVVMKSGNLNFLEPSGPLQVCNGTNLPFFYTVICVMSTVTLVNLSSAQANIKNTRLQTYRVIQKEKLVTVSIFVSLILIFFNRSHPVELFYIQ